MRLQYLKLKTIRAECQRFLLQCSNFGKVIIYHKVMLVFRGRIASMQRRVWRFGCTAPI